MNKILHVIDHFLHIRDHIFGPDHQFCRPSPKLDQLQNQLIVIKFYDYFWVSSGPSKSRVVGLGFICPLIQQMFCSRCGFLANLF